MAKHIQQVDVEYSRKFYHSKPKKIMKNIPDEVNQETIMILSHNPGCADFLEHLCGEWYRMPTAATALLTIKDQKYLVERRRKLGSRRITLAKRTIDLRKLLRIRSQRAVSVIQN